MQIYVGNLEYSVTEDSLRDLFGEHGEVVSAKVIIDRETGRSKGFGFVEMGNEEDALKAMDDLNGQELNGRSIKVNEAQRKSGGGGGGHGGGGHGGGGGGKRW